MVIKSTMVIKSAVVIQSVLAGEGPPPTSFFVAAPQVVGGAPSPARTVEENRS